MFNIVMIIFLLYDLLNPTPYIAHLCWGRRESSFGTVLDISVHTTAEFTALCSR